MKKCCKCKLSKEYKEFYKKHETHDGLQAYCKACHTQIRKEKYYERKELSRIIA